MTRTILGNLRIGLGLAIPGLLLSGCFTTRPVSIGELRSLTEAADVRLRIAGGEVLRARVGPTSVGAETIRFQPLLHGPESWSVRWAGWPAVWTAGKYWRHEIDGETAEVPLETVEEASIERPSGWRTALSLPVTLIPGIFDFIVDMAQFGFDQNDFTYDTFSRTPAGRPPLESE